jgi:hypothetical protein
MSKSPIWLLFSRVFLLTLIYGEDTLFRRSDKKTLRSFTFCIWVLFFVDFIFSFLYFVGLIFVFCVFGGSYFDWGGSLVVFDTKGVQSWAKFA